MNTDSTKTTPTPVGLMVVLCALFDSLPSCQRSFIRGAIQTALKNGVIPDRKSAEFLSGFISFDQ